MIKNIILKVLEKIISKIRFSSEASELCAKSLILQMKQNQNEQAFEDVEFKVYSQWGDDGIIQYLIHHIGIEEKTFIEFGVENYTESNTRFLLINNNWRGLVMDGSPENVQFIQKDSIYWKYDLTAVSAFITRENINSLILDNGFSGEVGILSIDIDGNDYYVWQCIDCINPVIVICEYNSVFGSEFAVTIPYDPKFIRTRAHYSNLYYGASLKALCSLAEDKGYSFVGCNSNGNNAYFVRNDKLKRLGVKTLKEGYVQSKFKESRFSDGRLSLLGGPERLNLIQDLHLFDVEKEELTTMRMLQEKERS